MDNCWHPAIRVQLKIVRLVVILRRRLQAMGACLSIGHGAEAKFCHSIMLQQHEVEPMDTYVMRAAGMNLLSSRRLTLADPSGGAAHH